MINDMCLRLHRDKRSEAFWCLVGERADCTAWLCILGSDLRQETDWKQQHKGRERETERERGSFLMAPTATVRVVVVCICGGSDRESHSRQAF